MAVHDRAGDLGELHREMANAAARTIDQHLLAKQASIPFQKVLRRRDQVSGAEGKIGMQFCPS